MCDCPLFIHSVLLSSQALVLGILAENSLPFAMAPVIIDVAKQLAKDPLMLQSLSMDRTSAMYKMQYGLSATLVAATVQHLRTGPFCMNIDEATSKTSKRVLGVLVSYFSPAQNRVVVDHLAAIELFTVDTKSILESLNTLFTEHEIPWQNLLAILMDSCAVMRGSKNGLEKKIRGEKNPSLLDFDGDACHHIHNASRKLAPAFEHEPEDLFGCLFRDHRYSADHRELLLELCHILGIKPTVPERFVNHRWLSALACCETALRLWDALSLFYFPHLSEGDQGVYRPVMREIMCAHKLKMEAKQRIHDIWCTLTSKKSATDEGKKRRATIVDMVIIKSDATLLALHFYQAVLPPLQEYVKAFQQDQPLIHKLNDCQFQLFKNFVACFLKPQNNPKKMVEMDLYDRKFLLEPDQIYIGKAKDVLDKLHKNDSLRE